MMDPIGLSLKVGRTFSIDFWWAVDIEHISTIKYPMLLIIILKFFLYVGCCMAHNKISVSISICWSHTKHVRNWKWGEFTQPTLNINTNLTFCFQADFLAGFDFPDMNLDMWNIFSKIKTWMPTPKMVPIRPKLKISLFALYRATRKYPADSNNFIWKQSIVFFIGHDRLSYYFF